MCACVRARARVCVSHAFKHEYKVQDKAFLTKKYWYFSDFSTKNRYSLEALHRDASNEFPQHMADDSHELSCFISSEI